MTRRFIPQVVVDLAHARREARAASQWDRADELRGEIEAAGWVIVDRGIDFELRPALPPDVVDGEIVLYGSSLTVPSLLGDPPSVGTTFVVVLEPNDEVDASGFGRLVGPLDAELVVVAVGPALAGAGAGLGQAGVEIVRTATPFAPAAARNAGLRRARGATVAVLQADTAHASDAATLRGLVSTLAGILADPHVAIAGTLALSSTDLRHFTPTMGPDATAVCGACVAFRRSDYVERGPFDEHLRSSPGLDIWWSLVLRDPGTGARPRRAVRLDLASASTAWTPDRDVGGDEVVRPDKRDAYRILDRFGRRVDILAAASYRDT